MRKDLYIKGIKRLNQYTDPELLGDGEVVELKDLVLDEEAGKPHKRGAVKKHNTNSIGGALRSIHETPSLVLGLYGDGDDDDDGILKKSSGTGAWTNIKTGLNDSNPLRMAVYGSKYYFVNGQDTPFLTDLTTAWDLDIDAPDVQGVSTTLNATGGLLGDTVLYRYLMVYVTEDGSYSQISKPFTHVESSQDIASTGIDGNDSITFADLPVSSDTRVTGRHLYRTEGDGQIYYFLASLNNVDTDYDDIAADTELDISRSIITGLAEVQTAEHVLIHRDRLFLGNVSTLYGKAVNTPAHLPMVATASDNAAAGLGDGVYRYKMSFLDAQGRESELSTYAQESVNYLSGSWAEGEARITITPLPYARVGADYLDHEIATRRLYRTKANGSTYYHVVDIPNSETTSFADAYIDSTNDTALTETYPKSGSGGTVTDTYPAGVVFSEVGSPSNIPYTNLLEIFPDDGDEIVGMVSEQNGILIFKKNSICYLYTQGSPNGWSVVRRQENVGCDTDGVIIKAKDKIYFTWNNQIYRYPDLLETPLSIYIRDSLEGKTIYDATYLTSKSWFVLACGDTVFIYDEKTEGWYEFSLTEMTIISVAEQKFGDNAGSLLLGDSGHGYLLIYDEDTGVDYKPDGDTTQDISPELKTKTYTFQNKEIRLRYLASNYKKVDDENVTHYLGDPENGTAKYDTDSTNSTIATDYKDYDEVTDAMTGALQETKKIYYRVYGAGLDRFNYAKLVYIPRRRGRV